MDTTEPKGPLLIIIIPIIIISVSAIILNSILLVLLNRTRNPKTFSLKLIKVVAIVDLISGINQCLCYVILSFMGKTESFSSIWYCRVFGSITIYIPTISSVLLNVLAFERYSIICRSSKLRPNATKWFLVIVSILVLIPITIVVINNSFYIDPTETYCLPDCSSWSRAVKLILGLTALISCFVISFCYLSVVNSCPKTDDRQYTRLSIWSRALSLTSTYLICFLPLMIALFWITVAREAPPVSLYILAPVCFTTITVANPILVLALHRPLTRELMLSLGWRSKPDPALELYSH